MHGASHDFAVFSDLSIFLPENAFRKFRRHSKEPDQDYPERRTRSTRSNGNRNPRNVSKPDRGRESCGQGLKMSDLSLLILRVVLAPYKVDRVFEEPEVHKAHAQGEKQCASKQPCHD